MDCDASRQTVGEFVIDVGIEVAAVSQMINE